MVLATPPKVPADVDFYRRFNADTVVQICTSLMFILSQDDRLRAHAPSGTESNTYKVNDIKHHDDHFTFISRPHRNLLLFPMPKQPKVEQTPIIFCSLHGRSMPRLSGINIMKFESEISSSLEVVDDLTRFERAS
jgi:hypothetical protein